MIHHRVSRVRHLQPNSISTLFYNTRALLLRRLRFSTNARRVFATPASSLGQADNDEASVVVALGAEARHGACHGFIKHKLNRLTKRRSFRHTLRQIVGELLVLPAVPHTVAGKTQRKAAQSLPAHLLERDRRTM